MVARPPAEGRSSSRCASRTSTAVQRIEQASFTTPWPPNAYRSELETNRLAHYLVARVDGRIVAYGGMWLMVDEAHITTFAVHPAWRRQRIGERLLLAFLDLAVDRHAREATLEVRLSNLAGAAAVREVRLPARRAPAALLQRQQRGRADHDDRAARRARPMRERHRRLRAALDAVAGADAADEPADAGPPGTAAVAEAAPCSRR